MPHVTIEYMIMMPLLIMQIILFPMTAGWLMNIWTDSRRKLALQDVGSHLGSAIQQLYFSLSHESVSAGTATYSPGLPPFIDDLPYVGNATLRVALGSEQNSSKILDLSIRMVTTMNTVTTMVVLGPNVSWQESTFLSNSTTACVSAQKLSNGTIRLNFGV